MRAWTIISARTRRRYRGARGRARFLGGDAVRLAARGLLRRGLHHQGAGQNCFIYHWASTYMT